MATAYDVPPRFLPDERAHRQKLGDALQGAMKGKLNVTSSITLTTGTTTTIKDARLSINSAVLQCPLSAGAAASQVWVSGQDEGQPPSTTRRGQRTGSRDRRAGC